MLLIGFFIFCIIVGIALIMIGKHDWRSEKHHFLYYHDDDFVFSGMITLVTSIIIVALMGFVSIGINSESEATLAKEQQRYEALMYKINSSDCRDEFGLLNKSICDEIQMWNEKISYNKIMQKNILVGAFYPNIYDELQLIELRVSR